MTLLSIFEELQFLSQQKFFFFFGLSKPEGRVGEQEGLEEDKESCSALRGKILLASQAEAFCALCLLSSHPVLWMGFSLWVIHQKSPLGQLQPASPCDFHRPRTAPPTASLLPANIYSFQNSPQRRREGCFTFLLVSAPAPETSSPLCCLLTEGTLHIWIGRGIIHPHPWADSGHVHLGRGSLTQKGGCGSCWTSGQKGLDCTDMHLDKLKPGCIVNPQGHLLVPAILSPVGQWNRWWHVRWMDRWMDAQVGR